MKKNIITLIFAAFLAVGMSDICSATAKVSPSKAASELARRVTGKAASSFKFVEVCDQDCETFTLYQKGGKIVIEGSTVNAMAVGLNHYLRHYCHAEYGWMKGGEITLKGPLPKVEGKVTASAVVPDRFFLNYCTYGYTMPWWTWDDWSHFIDWMALNGVNMALAITGQESIWYRVWLDMGLSDEQIRNYFTGPAHLPWHRMQNVDRWFAPLPMSWLDGQLELQKQIVARERELGIKPILPAFSGHVPREIKAIFPDAPITELEAWAGFPESMACSFLDPMSPLYSEIQKKFVEKEIEIFGTDHIYGIDVFNEVMPPKSQPDYLARVSRQIYESVAAADPEARWLQMGWLFVNARKYWTRERTEAYLTSFPLERQELLDYYCDKTEIWRVHEKFYGVPYIWCYLGNFGGNTNLCGVLPDIEARIDGVMAEGGSNFKGLGCTLEGLDCNPYVYEFILGKAWSGASSAAEYALQLGPERTGLDQFDSKIVWKNIIDSVYVGKTGTGQSSALCHRPNIGKTKIRYATAAISYENDVLGRALEALLALDGHGSSYNFDMVNLTRQWLSNQFNEMKAEYDAVYAKRDLEAMDALAGRMLELLDDIDAVLEHENYFLVGKWIADARYWGTSPEEKLYFERNARNLITSWSDVDMTLNDYAARALNGLVRDYYKPRYEIFFRHVHACVAEEREWNDEAYAAYNKEVTTCEKRWWNEAPGQYTSVATGGTKEHCLQLVKKYHR